MEVWELKLYFYPTAGGLKKKKKMILQLLPTKPKEELKRTVIYLVPGAHTRVMHLSEKRACLNSVRPCGTGRNGTRLFMAVCSVPTVGKKSCLVPSRILGLASPISSNDSTRNLLRT